MARITLYKQSDSMQCGIACLQMICKYHGRDVNKTRHVLIVKCFLFVWDLAARNYWRMAENGQKKYVQ